MKYFHCFEEKSDFNSEYYSKNYKEPWASVTKDSGTTKYNKTEEDKLLETPLTFKVNSSGNIYWLSTNSGFCTTIEYKKNDGEWTPITATTGDGTSISVITDDIVQFRGENGTTYKGTNRFYTDISFELYGNINSMERKEDFGLQENFLLPKYTIDPNFFENFFKGCTGLTSAKKLKLPSPIARNSCYQAMFSGCTSLTEAPEIPATEFEYEACEQMFKGCPLSSMISFDKIETLGSLAFQNAFSIQSEISLPNLNTMGAGAFYNNQFTKVVNTGNITNFTEPLYSRGAFAENPYLEEVFLKPEITNVNFKAFYNDTALTIVHWNNSATVTTIGTEAFYKDPVEGVLNLPIVTEIGSDAFYLSKFSEIIVPSITYLGQRAFWHSNDDVLKKVTLSNCFTEFNGNHHFANRNSLSTIILPTVTPPTLSNWESFPRCALIWIPSEGYSDYCVATNWSLFTPKLREIGKTYFYGTLLENKNFNRYQNYSIADSDNFFVTDFISVTAGNTYRSTANANLGSCWVVFYDSSKTYISAQGLNPNPYYNPSSQFTAPENAAYARMSFYRQPDNQPYAAGIFDETNQQLIYPYAHE